MDEKFSNMPEQDQNAEAADNSYQQTMNYGSVSYTHLWEEQAFLPE